MTTRIKKHLLLFILLVIGGFTNAEELFLVGLINNAWYPLICSFDGECETVEEVKNPKSIAYDDKAKKIAYVDQNSDLAIFSFADSTTEIIKKWSPSSAFSYLSFDDESRLYYVELVNGKSLKTKIYEYFQGVHRVTFDRGASFNPSVYGNKVYFSYRICHEVCHAIELHIYEYDKMTQIAQPIIESSAINQGFKKYAQDTEMVWSSDVSGNFEVWYKKALDAKPKQITFSPFSDLFPHLGKSEDIIWLRKDRGKDRVLRAKLFGDQTEQVIKLPDNIKKIKHLELIYEGVHDEKY